MNIKSLFYMGKGDVLCGESYRALQDELLRKIENKKEQSGKLSVACVFADEALCTDVWRGFLKIFGNFHKVTLFSNPKAFEDTGFDKILFFSPECRGFGFKCDWVVLDEGAARVQGAPFVPEKIIVSTVKRKKMLQTTKNLGRIYVVGRPAIIQNFVSAVEDNPLVQNAEEILERIKTEEIAGGGYSPEEIKKLTKTLGCAFGTDPTMQKSGRFYNDVVRYKKKYGLNTDVHMASPPNCSLARRQDLIALQGWVDLIMKDGKCASVLGLNPQNPNRKLWEWVYISQVLHEREMLQVGRRGMGFAVGKEPLPALFASLGADIIATDLGVGGGRSDAWATGDQHAADLNALLYPEICKEKDFLQKVKFMPMDMNNIPDMGGMDFCWSSCAFEHIGTPKEARKFLLRTLELLNPGGVSVHTTEFNLSQDGNAGTKHNNVFGRGFFEKLANEIQALGHYIAPFDYRLGNHPEEEYIFQWEGTDPHFKLVIENNVATSIGVIMVRAQ
jgi:hypothetical protein